MRGAMAHGPGAKMGNEATCTMKMGKQETSGKALLETSELIFRPADGSPRVKIPFAMIKSAKAIDGELRLQTSDGTATFNLGPAAAKWCAKILHPKTRADKLGLKPGITISLLGSFDPDFQKELQAAKVTIVKGKIDPVGEMIFFAADSTTELKAGLASAAKSLKGATALWIVYPKGQKQITENDVLTAGRKANLKDIKVVGFSPTHTALKFVLPVARY
jgi:hypothetical protein